jgi:hypothetical protein
VSSVNRTLVLPSFAMIRGGGRRRISGAWLSVDAVDAMDVMLEVERFRV